MVHRFKIFFALLLCVPSVVTSPQKTAFSNIPPTLKFISQNPVTQNFISPLLAHKFFCNFNSNSLSYRLLTFYHYNMVKTSGKIPKHPSSPKAPLRNTSKSGKGLPSTNTSKKPNPLVLNSNMEVSPSPSTCNLVSLPSSKIRNLQN